MRYRVTRFAEDGTVAGIATADVGIGIDAYVTLAKEASGPRATFLVEQMEEMADGSHGPPKFTVLSLGYSREMREIEGLLWNAGFRGFEGVKDTVVFAIRQLEQSQKESQSLRRRINELLKHVRVEPNSESQSAHSSEVCITTNGQGAKGDSSRAEGEGSRTGVGSSEPNAEKENV